MTLIAIASTIILLSLAVIHIYWGFGGLWPGKTKQELIDLVFGQGNQFPSRFMCLFVAIFLALFSFLPIVWCLRDNLGFNDDLIFGLKLIMGIVSVIFFLRGSFGYAPFVTKHWKPIFVYYTMRVYNPLCLFIGLVFLALIL